MSLESVLRVFIPTSGSLGDIIKVEYIFIKSVAGGAISLSFQDIVPLSIINSVISNPTGTITFDPFGPNLSITALLTDRTTKYVFSITLAAVGEVAEGLFTPTLLSPGAEMQISTGPLLVTSIVCVAEGSLVSLADNYLLPIEDLRPGDLLRSNRHTPVPLAGLIRFTRPVRNIYRVQFPDHKPILIARGHPLLVDGKEVLPEDLVATGLAIHLHLETPITLYTLLTENREFVDFEGIGIATWSKKSWVNFVMNDSVGSQLEWKFIQ